MDEFWRGLATVVVGVVPALLLYLQNKNSEDRAKEERKEIRDQENARQSAESLQAKREAELAETERLRGSLVRFICIADKIATERSSLDPEGGPTSLGTEDAEELTSAYADASLQVQHQRLLDAIDGLRSAVMDIVATSVNFGPPLGDGYEEAFRAAMDRLRSEARDALNMKTIVQSGDSVTVYN